MISKILSIVLFLLLSPILLIVAIAILLDDGFPILFKQKRVGQNNTHFWVHKFRTMKINAPNIATHLLEDSDSLYTSIGPFLRKFSFDELPQLIDIIKGNMVFIGPRPALYNQDDLIELRTKVGIHKLIPGITGWAQVNGRDELSIAEKVRMDEYYLINKSLWLNIKILFKTFINVIKKESIIQ